MERFLTDAKNQHTLFVGMKVIRMTAKKYQVKALMYQF